MSKQHPGQRAGLPYRIPVTVQATAAARVLCYTNARVTEYNEYIRDLRGYPPHFVRGERVISGRRFDDPDLPVVSLSPAMTISDAIAPVVQVAQVEEVDT